MTHTTDFVQDGHDTRKHDRVHYTVGWICALSVELAASIAMLDRKHPDIQLANDDNNVYTLGEIQSHNVVMTGLPHGKMGTESAATVARDMARSFPELKFVLLVGIGGGAPRPDEDPSTAIFLGDVVVSKPAHGASGVIQYDFGAAVQGEGFVQTGILNKAPPILRSSTSRLEAKHLGEPSIIPDIISGVFQSHPLIAINYQRPNPSTDVLFKQDYRHVDKEKECVDGCDRDCLVERTSRSSPNPVVHYGLIASANQVMKDASVRERLRQEHHILCFEMEAAGLMDNCQCLVIRGICDYADSHKTDRWQPYAALTAAAYAKELLMTTPSTTKESIPTSGSLEDSNDVLPEIQKMNRKEQEQEIHSMFRTSNYEEMKDIHPHRIEGTCKWVSDNPKYLRWLNNNRNDVLWISADPGCGKSVLAKSLVEDELRSSSSLTTCYFFFKDNDQQNSLSTALCALIHQLLSQKSFLVGEILEKCMSEGKSLLHNNEVLWNILLSLAMHDQAGQVTCVLDALDESKESDRNDFLRRLTSFYTEFSKKSNPTGVLKFLLISRPYGDIEAGFQRGLRNFAKCLPDMRIRGEDENEQLRNEINIVIEKRVDELDTEFVLEPSTKSRLLERLKEIPNRTYLWLHLSLAHFQDVYKDSLRPHDETIDTLPVTLQDFYDALLKQVSERNHLKARQIFQIVVGARRPLTVGELAVALNELNNRGTRFASKSDVDPAHMVRRIRDWCGLFIYFDRYHVYLIHQTAKDFLFGRLTALANLSWKYVFSPADAELTMALICVAHLIRQPVPAEQALASRRRNPGDQSSIKSNLEFFWHYAATYWPEHVCIAQKSPTKFPMKEVWELYNGDEERFQRWFRRSWSFVSPDDWNNPININKVRVAAIAGHFRVLERMIETDKASLTQAIRNGVSESSRPWSALDWASIRGHEKVVELLLANGADVNLKANIGVHAVRNACKEGHNGILKMLLDHAGDEVPSIETRRLLLGAAAKSGSHETVSTLLDFGATVNATLNVSDAPPATANEPETEYEKGRWFGHLFDFDAVLVDSLTALAAASEAGNTCIVELLLEHGASVNAPSGGEYTPLIAAAYSGHEETVQFLLEQGADAEVVSETYGTALNAATCEGHDMVCSELLLHMVSHKQQKGLVASFQWAIEHFKWKDCVEQFRMWSEIGGLDAAVLAEIEDEIVKRSQSPIVRKDGERLFSCVLGNVEQEQIESDTRT